MSENALISEALSFCLRCRGKTVVTAATVTDDKLRIIYACTVCKKRFSVEERAALKRELPYKLRQPTIRPPALAAGFVEGDGEDGS